MARYTYNAGLVSQTIDTLYSACDCLDSTNVDIKKGIDLIFSAHGSENLRIQYSVITDYYTSVVECIETMASEIKNKAKEIEEYQDAPWYKKLFATIGLGALKLIEGLATFVENIGDGIVSVLGFIGGIFSSEFKNSVAEFVRTDYVGETTAKWYEEGWLKDVNKYSIMSHESTAANILKGVGTAAGYVVLSVATAGAGTAVSLGVSATAAGVGGIGSGTQNALKEAQSINPEMSAGDAFNSAFGKGVKDGLVAAGTTLVAAGIAKGLGNAATSIKNGDDVIQVFTNVADKTDDMGKVAKAINSAKTVTNNVVTKIANTKVGNVILKTAGNAVNKAGGVVDDVAKSVSSKAGTSTIGKFISKGASNIAGNGVSVVSNAIGSVAGSSNPIKTNISSAEMDKLIKEMNNESVGEKLYNETQAALYDESLETKILTEEEAQQQLQELEAQGYRPEIDQSASTSQTDTTNTDSNVNTDSTTNNDSTTNVNSTPDSNSTTNSNASTSLNSSQNGNSNPLPSQSSGNQTITVTAPTYTPPSNTESVTETTDDFISTINPVNTIPTGNTISTGTGNNISVNPSNGIQGIMEENEITKETISSEVLNTFGDAASSLSGISSSKTHIPTSSAPILSSSDGAQTKSSFVPLGAGLGAASLAGIGAKAVIDNREKQKEEENDKLETEEWTNQEDMEIDLGIETSPEESDYLSPTDELAFTE